jgi:hypothetical protein
MNNESLIVPRGRHVIRKNLFRYPATFIAVSLGLTVFAALLACSRESSKRAVIEVYEQTFNAHRVDSLLALFSADAEVEFAGMGPVLTGKSMIADKARYDSVLAAHIKIDIDHINRDTVFATAVETDKWLSRAGLPPSVYSPIMFVISGGKITDLQAELTDSSVTAINHVMQGLIPWAQANEPDKLNQLIPQGVFSYGIKSANLSLELLKDWQNRRSDLP